MQTLEQEIIGQYQVIRHFKRGGMANIYLGKSLKTDEKVAIKVVANSSDDYCQRFQREASVMVGLKHPHILPVLDYGTYNDWCYMVTPFIEHGTLSMLLDRGGMTFDKTAHILKQLTSALQFAHDRGIIHRDIKPSNVLMREGQDVYLADFGLVKYIGEEHGLTVTGFLIGTPEYMAPELAEGEATPCSDIYALGVLLYQLLTGSVPFTGHTPISVFLKHIHEFPTLPTMRNPAIPTEVEQVILKALAKNPHQRYQSAHELYQAYVSALHSMRTSNVIVTTDEINLPEPWIQVKRDKTSQNFQRRRLWAFTSAASVCVITPLLFNFVFHSPEKTAALQNPTNVVTPVATATPTKLPPTPTPTKLPPTPTPTAQPKSQPPTPASVVVQQPVQPQPNTSNGGKKKPPKQGGGTTTKHKK